MQATWKPNVTVAAVVERDRRFLLVEENTAQGLRINQPAGHLEAGESLTAAVTRETLEESAYDFRPAALLGLYLLPTGPLASDITYLRVAFTGELGAHHAERALDTGIVRAVWLTRDEIAAQRDILRSPLVLQCVDDYLKGQRGSLELVAFSTLSPVAARPHPGPLPEGEGEGGGRSWSSPHPGPLPEREGERLPSPAQRERGRG